MSQTSPTKDKLKGHPKKTAEKITSPSKQKEHSHGTPSRTTDSETTPQKDDHHKNEEDECKERVRSVEFVPPTAGTPAAQALAANATIKVSKVGRLQHKFRGMKRPKMKSLNLVRKVNKNRKKKKLYSTNFKGKVIDGLHELYTLTAGMMLGIRYSVGMSLKNNSKIEAKDFSYVEKITFPPRGNSIGPFITPPHKLAHTFKFKSYSPKVFRKLRDFFCVEPAAYMQSVCGDYNFIEFISNSKSGQFFFYSHDGQYMLKTQTKEENKFMKRILPHYYKFVTKNQNSLLVRILGMYRLKMYHLRRKVHFVIMSSVFKTPAQINTIYDLKGSLYGRTASEKERASGGVLKDNDLINDGCKLHLGPKKADFIAQIERDAMFLSEMHIMDYSLLVGIHSRRKRIHNPEITENHSTTVDHNTIELTSLALSPDKKPFSSEAGSEPETGVPPSLTMEIEIASNSPTNMGGGNFERDLSVTTIDTNMKTESVNMLKAANRRSITFSHNSESLSIDPSSSHDGSGGAPKSSPGKSSSPATAERRGSTNRRRSSATQRRGSNTVQSPVMERPALLTDPTVNSLSVDHSTVHDDFGQYSDEGDSEDEEEDDDDFLDIDAGDSDLDDLDHSHVHSHSAAGSKSNGNPRAVSSLQDDEFQKELSKNMEEAEVKEKATLTEDKVKEKSKKVKKTSFFGRKSMVDEDSSVDSEDEPPTKSGFAAAIDAAESTKNLAAPEYTHGSWGSALKHPWTARIDEGINSRDKGGKRGDDIYFVGIIDILQEYNINKRVETIFKGFTHDVSQISSVDPVTYAKRFIKFMDDNTD